MRNDSRAPSESTVIQTGCRIEIQIDDQTGRHQRPITDGETSKTKPGSAANWKPSKKRSPERIDGIVAAVMALAQAMNKPIRRKSVYERRGVLVA